MLRKSQLVPTDALPMLREKGLKKYTEVVTADGVTLGVAMRYYHRSPEEVDPLLRLYRTYLEIQTVELGGPAYIPTVFISSFDPKAKKVTLSATFAEVKAEGWNRQPDFVARGWGVPEELDESA